jgi:hypothetical protein
MRDPGATHEAEVRQSRRLAQSPGSRVSTSLRFVSAGMTGLGALGRVGQMCESATP